MGRHSRYEYAANPEDSDPRDPLPPPSPSLLARVGIPPVELDEAGARAREAKHPYVPIGAKFLVRVAMRKLTAYDLEDDDGPVAARIHPDDTVVRGLAALAAHDAAACTRYVTGGWGSALRRRHVGDRGNQFRGGGEAAPSASFAARLGLEAAVVRSLLALRLADPREVHQASRVLAKRLAMNVDVCRGLVCAAVLNRAYRGGAAPAAAGAGARFSGGGSGNKSGGGDWTGGGGKGVDPRVKVERFVERAMGGGFAGRLGIDASVAASVIKAANFSTESWVELGVRVSKEIRVHKALKAGTDATTHEGGGAKADERARELLDLMRALCTDGADEAVYDEPKETLAKILGFQTGEDAEAKQQPQPQHGQQPQQEGHSLGDAAKVFVSIMDEDPGGDGDGKAGARGDEGAPGDEARAAVRARGRMGRRQSFAVAHAAIHWQRHTVLTAGEIIGMLSGMARNDVSCVSKACVELFKYDDRTSNLLEACILVYNRHPRARSVISLIDDALADEGSKTFPKGLFAAAAAGLLNVPAQFARAVRTLAENRARDAARVHLNFVGPGAPAQPVLARVPTPARFAAAGRRGHDRLGPAAGSVAALAADPAWRPNAAEVLASLHRREAHWRALSAMHRPTTADGRALRLQRGEDARAKAACLEGLAALLCANGPNGAALPEDAEARGRLLLVAEALVAALLVDLPNLARCASADPLHKIFFPRLPIAALTLRFLRHLFVFACVSGGTSAPSSRPTRAPPARPPCGRRAGTRAPSSTSAAPRPRAPPRAACCSCPSARTRRATSWRS